MFKLDKDFILLDLYFYDLSFGLCSFFDFCLVLFCFLWVFFNLWSFFWFYCVLECFGGGLGFILEVKFYRNSDGVYSLWVIYSFWGFCLWLVFLKLL